MLCDVLTGSRKLASMPAGGGAAATAASTTAAPAAGLFSLCLLTYSRPSQNMNNLPADLRLHSHSLQIFRYLFVHLRIFNSRYINELIIICPMH